MAKAKEPAAREGWIRALVSRKDEDGYYFSASSDGKEVVRLDGEFYIWVPVTTEAQAEAMAGASTSFDTGPDSKEKVKGPEAPAARKYYSDALEPCRGELRDKAVEGIVLSAEAFQVMLDGASPYTGRGGRKAPEVSLEEMEGMATKDLAAYLASRGVKVS